MSQSNSVQLEHLTKLHEQVMSTPRTTIDRIQSAMTGAIPIDQLSQDEKEIFDDLVSIDLWKRSAEGNAEFAAKLMSEAGNVGYDDDGNLVETVGDGKNVRIVKPKADS